MDESIEVVPSEETTSTPSEPIEKEETTTESPVEPTEPVVEESNKFELPDGRKVDGETLAREWKENFLPEFTRKSQALAEYERAKDINNNPKDSPYANPEYVPSSYEELLQVAEERALKAIENKRAEEIERQQAIENEVASQLSDIKAIDPNLNENELFLHANKFGFRDLRLAHQNMKYVSEAIKKTQESTVKNIAKRADPVSTTSRPTGTVPNPSSFQTARDFLKSLHG